MTKSTMLATDSTKHIFPFFELPLELREMVYDASLTTYTTHMPGEFLVEGKGVARPNLMCISKQFKAELEVRAKKHSHLRIKDVSHDRHMDDHSLALPPSARLSRAATKIRSLTLQLAMDPLFERDLATMRDWINSKLLPWLPSLTSLSIRIATDIYWPGAFDVDDWRTALAEQKWNGFVTLKSLRLIAVDSGVVVPLTGGASKGKVVLEWSKGKNEFEEILGGEEVQDDAEDQDVLSDARESRVEPKTRHTRRASV